MQTSAIKIAASEQRLVPEIRTERLLLRLGAQEDAKAMVNFLEVNRAHLEPVEPKKPPEVYTDEYWVDMFGKRAEAYLDDKALWLLAFRQGNEGEVVATANFTNFIRGIKQSCNLGYSLTEREQGKGLMGEALSGAIGYAFNTLQFHRIEANYMPHNIRSGRVLKKLGFVVEGYARDYLKINGRWEDHILTSLTNPSALL